jgi:hypothetical protein
MDTEEDFQHNGHMVDMNTKKVIRTTEANKSGIVLTFYLPVS